MTPANKKHFKRLADDLDRREKLFYSDLTRLLSAITKPYKYTSGLVRGNNHINETNYHHIYKLVKPFKVALKCDGGDCIDYITHIGSNFFMTEDSGLGSYKFTALTKHQLINLYDHIDKRVK